MSGWGWFILILIVLIIPGCFAGYIFYKRIKAKRAGQEPPPISSFVPFARQERHTDVYPAPSGIFGWVKSKFASLKNSRSKSGAYEPTGAGARRGLDPDEAWDARVGAEADGYGPGGYYEEQELGLRPPGGGAYGGSGYGEHGRDLPDYSADVPRGRSLSRNEGPYIGGGQKGLDQRYDEETGHEDPFGDNAEVASQLRGVSPRPHEEGTAKGLGKGHAKQGSGGTQQGDSPTERRSMFHENV
ncbi:hypothetical protein MMC21_005811 [Puttea exsequens]|nr:hypothetical protein [Puttea exsequens]